MGKPGQDREPGATIQRQMTIIDLEQQRQMRARRWRSSVTLGYTGLDKKPGELTQAVPATESQAKDTAPESLVRRIRSGDRAAEALLVETYRKPILELLRHRTRNPDLAEDLLQDTLLIILKRLRNDGIAEPLKLSAYMHRVAHNLVISHFRKEARQNTTPDSETIELIGDQQPTEQEAFLNRERDRLVAALLEELNQPRDREILQRFYVWNQEKQLVCDAMDLNSDQFDKVVSRARKRFKALVGEKMRD